MKSANRIATAALLLSFILFLPLSAFARTGAEISREARSALRQLVAKDSEARALSHKAHAVLVFPSIVKGGFLLAGQRGDGALLSRDGTNARLLQEHSRLVRPASGDPEIRLRDVFRRPTVSCAAAPKGGWELGSAPCVVVVNRGKSGSLSTTNFTKRI
jgi:hypothetical protein